MKNFRRTEHVVAQSSSVRLHLVTTGYYATHVMPQMPPGCFQAYAPKAPTYVTFGEYYRWGKQEPLAASRSTSGQSSSSAAFGVRRAVLEAAQELAARQVKPVAILGGRRFAVGHLDAPSKVHGCCCLRINRGTSFRTFNSSSTFDHLSATQ